MARGEIRQTTSSAATFVGRISTSAKVVIGIDFGTAYSGVSYVYTDVPETVHCGAPGARQRAIDALKVPTVLLQTPDGWAFGDDALDRYTRAIEDCEDEDETSAEGLRRRGVSLYRRFKMVLKDRTSGDFDSLMATSTTGDSHSLMDLVTRSLEFLSRFALEEVQSGFGGTLDLSNDGDILWVLTLPAIWNDYGKAFMRQAAYRAEMTKDEASDNLLLALEPESASLAVHSEATRLGLFNEGATFMVLDCGGGTVDITTHRVQTKEPLVLDELAVPRGGPWGGEYVDEEFTNFLGELLGASLWERLQRTFPGEVATILQEFRSLKEAFDPEVDDSFRINLSGVFSDDEITAEIGLPDLLLLVKSFNQTTKRKVSFDLSKKNVESRIRTRHVLNFTNEQVVDYFFEPSLKQICSSVHAILDRVTVASIVIVGGYGASRVLAHRVRSEFEGDGIHVIVPSRPQAAIVQGAAYFGLYTDVVGSRIAKYTYGVAIQPEWTERCGFPRSLARMEGGKLRVPDVFSKIVSLGTSIPSSEKFSRSGYRSTVDNEGELIFRIFRSESANPQRVTDASCRKLGELRIPVRGRSDTFNVEFNFTTELRIRIVRSDGTSRNGTVEMV